MVLQLSQHLLTKRSPDLYDLVNHNAHTDGLLRDLANRAELLYNNIARDLLTSSVIHVNFNFKHWLTNGARDVPYRNDVCIWDAKADGVNECTKHPLNGKRITVAQMREG